MNEQFSNFERTGAITPRKLAVHLGLLAVTFVTTTVAGILYPFGMISTLPDDDPQSFAEVVDMLLALPYRYGHLVYTAFESLLTNSEYLIYGLSFSLSLLFILVSHEMGHYIACRIYKVDATLPFLIPTPPMIGPAGTFGAFIKITSPLPSRKAIFDIGVAGPIAGFIALIPVAIIGVMSARTLDAGAEPFAVGIIFSDPLLTQMIAAAFDVDLTRTITNPFLSAAWVGLLVTALNLIPSGQLDGGHAVFAVFGKAIHGWTGKIAFVVMGLLSILGWFYFNSPSGFLITILLGVMLRIRHPEPWDMSPLGKTRLAVAALTLLIFILCFTPFPIKVL
jgi:membrane-associated protease RseP (regulator of RpoE activity)